MTSDDLEAGDFPAADLNAFMKGYLEAWLHHERLPPAPPGEDWPAGKTFEEAGFGRDKLAVESVPALRSRARDFLTKGASLIPGNPVGVQRGGIEQAGYDAALVCQGFGKGFPPSRWKPEAGDALARIAAGLGALPILVADGEIFVGFR